MTSNYGIQEWALFALASMLGAIFIFANYFIQEIGWSSLSRSSWAH
jgi:hypothetical protein